MSWLNVFPTLFLVTSAILSSGSTLRRRLAAVMALSALVAPYLLPEDWHAVRGVSAVITFIAVVRCFDLVIRREPTPVLRRILHVFSAADSFHLRRVPPSVSWASLLRMALFLPLAIAARFIALDVVSTPIAALVVREAFAIIAAYAISDFAYALLNTIYRALGFAPPVLHRDPVLSRSLRDFWGRRWNRIVGAWLDATFYRPWARRRQRAIGMSLAFAFSALVHVYVTHPALGTRWSLIVGAFFLVQGLFTLLEGPLGVARWPTLYARVWTLTIMALTAPMICEAFLRLSERWP